MVQVVINPVVTFLHSLVMETEDANSKNSPSIARVEYSPCQSLFDKTCFHPTVCTLAPFWKTVEKKQNFFFLKIRGSFCRKSFFSEFFFGFCSHKFSNSTFLRIHTNPLYWNSTTVTLNGALGTNGEPHAAVTIWLHWQWINLIGLFEIITSQVVFFLSISLFGSPSFPDWRG